MKIDFRKLLLSLYVLIPGMADAVQAHPELRVVENPDGTTVTLRLLGDEFGHVTVDAEGRIMKQDDKGNWKVSEENFTYNVGINVIKETLDKRRSLNMQRRIVKGERSANTEVNRSTFPRTGEVHALVVLVDFPDVNFVTSDIKREVEEMLNLPGFDRREHIGSAADYFHMQSRGQFSPQFDVYGPVRADKVSTWYGENDANGDDLHAPDLAIEICSKLDGEIDFTQYDLDADGYIDNLYFFYAGYGENFAGNKASWIWPHAAHLDEFGIPSAERTFDGKTLNSYGCCAELYGSTGADVTSIGTFCHEFSHILGLPDTYDVNYQEDGTGNHPDKWDIMASGSYLPATRNCGAVPAGYTAVERWLLGWDEPVEILFPHHVSLPALQTSGKSVRISTSHPDEFFILENRQQCGYDRFIPSHGLLVWHVDRRSDAYINVTIGGENKTLSCADTWNLENNAVNSNAAHQCLEIEKASGNDGSKSSFDTPFPGRQMRTEFTDDTNPSMRSWNGNPTGKSVTGISEIGGIVSLDFMGGGESPNISGLEIYDITDSGFKVRWDDNPLALDGYIIALYNVERTTESDVEVLNLTFTQLPDGWSLDGTATYSDSGMTMGGSEATTLTTCSLDLSRGATLTIRASQSGMTACALKVYAGEELVDEYLPTTLASDYTLELPPTSSESLSFVVDRRKSVVIERIVLHQAVEQIALDKLSCVKKIENEHYFEELDNGSEYACTVLARGFMSEPSEPVFATLGLPAGLEDMADKLESNFNGDDEVTGEYYNLQGMRIGRPKSRGIYILKQHNKTKKIRL